MSPPIAITPRTAAAIRKKLPLPENSDDKPDVAVAEELPDAGPVLDVVAVVEGAATGALIGGYVSGT